MSYYEHFNVYFLDEQDDILKNLIIFAGLLFTQLILASLVMLHHAVIVLFHVLVTVYYLFLFCHLKCSFSKY